MEALMVHSKPVSSGVAVTGTAVELLEKVTFTLAGSIVPPTVCVRVRVTACPTVASNSGSNVKATGSSTTTLKVMVACGLSSEVTTTFHVPALVTTPFSNAVAEFLSGVNVIF